MKNYKFINTYSDFVLNETLKTHDKDLTIRVVNTELSLLKYNFSIKSIDNKIHISLYNVNTTQLFKLLLENLNILMTDRHGWFPSIMIINNLHGLKNELQYDIDYLIEKSVYFQSVEIIYEPKFDVVKKTPNKLYHLSIQEYENKVLKNGLIPKSKSKLSKHLDRVYLCLTPNECRNLITRMKLYYKGKIGSKTINDKWIIYEIDSINLNIKLYEDPNYKGGYYTVDNISPTIIKIFEKEI